MANTARFDAPEKLWSLKEVSEFLQIPESTILTWRVDGKGPHGYRVGRYLRFRQSDVEVWLDAQADPA